MHLNLSLTKVHLSNMATNFKLLANRLALLGVEWGLLYIVQRTPTASYRVTYMPYSIDGRLYLVPSKDLSYALWFRFD